MASGRQDKVAKRYARALFEVTEPGSFDRVGAQLAALSTAWATSVEFRQSMLNPRVSNAMRLSVIDALVESVGGWATDAVKRALHTIVTLRKAAILPSVSEIFTHLVSEYRKSLSLEVTFAAQPQEADLAGIKSRLSQALGGEVSLSVKSDPKLLGGVTIRLGDKLLDRSVAGTLQRMATQLTK